MSATDATNDIMQATYRALCTHGFADLTMQDIADEAGRSKAALHYHYDTKQELLVSFLEYLFDDFTERLDADSADDPVEELLTVLDTALSPPSDVGREFETAILEIKAQAPYDDAYQDQLATFDRYVHDRLARIIREGIEAGDFREVDPDETAELLKTIIDGTHTRRVSLGRSTAPVRAALARMLEESLLTDENRSLEGLIA